MRNFKFLHITNFLHISHWWCWCQIWGVCIGCTKLILNQCDKIHDPDKILNRSWRRRIHLFYGGCRCIDFIMAWERNPLDANQDKRHSQALHDLSFRKDKKTKRQNTKRQKDLDPLKNIFAQKRLFDYNLFVTTGWIIASTSLKDVY